MPPLSLLPNDPHRMASVAPGVRDPWSRDEVLVERIMAVTLKQLSLHRIWFPVDGFSRKHPMFGQALCEVLSSCQTCEVYLQGMVETQRLGDSPKPQAFA